VVARTVVGMGRVTFVDETTSGGRGDGWGLDIAEERLTVRELIRRRVWKEVTDHNTGRSRRTDPEAQVETAWKAFEGNGFLVLVGDRQVTELDEEIELAPGTEITFLKLVALAGG
jgi:hypothetical protein